MAVVGRLVENGQQTIVKTHRYPESFKRTVRELYGMVYIALRSLCLTIPKRDTAEDRRNATKKGAGTADALSIPVGGLSRAAEGKSSNIERWRPDCRSPH